MQPESQGRPNPLTPARDDILSPWESQEWRKRAVKALKLTLTQPPALCSASIRSIALIEERQHCTLKPTEDTAMLSLISHPRFILPSIATLAVGCAAAPVAGTTHPATVEIGRLPEYTSFPGIVIPQVLPTDWLTPQYDSKKWRIGNNPDLPFKYASWMSPAGDNPRLTRTSGPYGAAAIAFAFSADPSCLNRPRRGASVQCRRCEWQTNVLQGRRPGRSQL